MSTIVLVTDQVIHLGSKYVRNAIRQWFLVFLLAAVAGSARASESPNIVLIVTDNQSMVERLPRFTGLTP